MFNRILVAVDGSEPSLNALKASLPLVRAEKGAALVVSVIPPYNGELRLVGVKNVAATLRGPYEKALAESENIAREAGVRIFTTLAQGEPHEQIVDVAEAEGCELIVVGVRGFNPAERVVMGSMTARIIGYSYTNVLVVPRLAPFRWDNILVTLDGSQLGTSALTMASSFQKSYGSRVTLLSVADVPHHVYGIDPTVAEGFIATARKVLDDAIAEATSMGLTVDPLIKEGDPSDIIVDVSQQRQHDLLIMGSHGRTGLRRLLMGSVTERVISHATCPIMVMRA